MAKIKSEVDIQIHECKGCGLCVVSCPNKNLSMSNVFNKLGYNYAEWKPVRCTACGMCFLACPEPGAIKVTGKEEKE